MPIHKPVDPDSPLGQGDILKSIKLFHTDKPSEHGGSPKSLEMVQPLCMVLSRPCNAIRDDFIVVAAVEKLKVEHTGQFEEFEEVCDYFVERRDGHTAPDFFYLGPFDGYDGVMCARFDRVYTVCIPKGDALRKEFLRSHRVSRLSVDFIRDLHARQFRAFTSMGFDDYDWYSTADLELIIAVADRDIAAVSGQIAEIDAQIRFSTSQASTGNVAGLKSQHSKLNKKLTKIQQTSQPFRDTLTARKAPQ